MSRVVSLLLVAVLAVLPVTPMPRVCRMRMPAARMHPCCPATTTRAPMKATTIRVDAAPPAAPPRVLWTEPPAGNCVAGRTMKRGAFRQSQATIQLRI